MPAISIFENSINSIKKLKNSLELIVTSLSVGLSQSSSGCFKLLHIAIVTYYREASSVLAAQVSSFLVSAGMDRSAF